MGRVERVAGGDGNGGGGGGSGGCSHLSSKRIAMVTRPRRHRLKGLVRRGWRPGLVGMPARFILNFKKVSIGSAEKRMGYKATRIQSEKRVAEVALASISRSL